MYTHILWQNCQYNTVLLKLITQYLNTRRDDACWRKTRGPTQVKRSFHVIYIDVLISLMNNDVFYIQYPGSWSMLLIVVDCNSWMISMLPLFKAHSQKEAPYVLIDFIVTL